MKECNNCFEFKDFDKFNKRAKSPDGLQFICKKCQSELFKENYDINKEEFASKRKSEVPEYKAAKRKFRDCFVKKSNKLDSYIGISINDLVLKFESLGFKHSEYGKTWAIRLKMPVSSFYDKFSAFKQENLECYNFN